MIAGLLFMVLLVICGRMEEGVKYCFLLPQSVFRVIHQEFEKTGLNELEGAVSF